MSASLRAIIAAASRHNIKALCQRGTYTVIIWIHHNTERLLNTTTSAALEAIVAVSLSLEALSTILSGQFQTVVAFT